MIMRVSWSLALGSLNGVIEEAQLCEARGLDGVWFPDYQAPFSEWAELYIALTTIALKTERVFLGSFITDFLRRHPMVTAHAFASLSHLAPGRVILGLGAGAGPSHTPFGITIKNPCSRLREGIEVVRMLWSATKEEKANYQGKFFRLNNAGPPLTPRGTVPIYVAAYGPCMLRVAAESADGWIPECHTPTTYAETLRRLRELMRGRSYENIEPCCALIFYPWEPDNKAYERILRAAKDYLAMYPDIQWAAGEGKKHPGLRTHQIIHDNELLEELSSQVPDWLADATLIYGDMEKCIDRLMKFSEAGCRHVILEPYWIERNRVMDAIREAGRMAAALRAH